MRILIITNKTNNDVINPGLLHLFGAVQDLFNSVNGIAKCDVIVVGHDLSATSHHIASYSVVNQVLQLDHLALNNILSENIAPTLAQLVKDYNIELFVDNMY